MEFTTDKKLRELFDYVLKCGNRGEYKPARLTKNNDTIAAFINNSKDREESYLPAICIALYPYKKGNLETFLEVSEELGYRYIVHEKRTDEKEQIIDQCRSEFEIIKASSDIDSDGKNSIYFMREISDNHTRILSNLIDIELIEIKKDSKTDFKDLIVIPYIGKEYMQKIRSAYKIISGKNFSNKFILKKNISDQYKTILDDTNLIDLMIEDIKEKDFADKKNNPETLSENYIQYMNNLFDRTENTSKIEEISEFLSRVIISKDLERIISDYQREKTKPIIITNNKKDMALEIRKTFPDEGYGNNLRFQLYIKNIEYNKRFDILKKLSKNAKSYTLDFSPIEIGIFKEILRSEKPFENYINTAMKYSYISDKLGKKSTELRFGTKEAKFKDTIPYLKKYKGQLQIGFTDKSHEKKIKKSSMMTTNILAQTSMIPSSRKGNFFNYDFIKKHLTLIKQDIEEIIESN